MLTRTISLCVIGLAFLLPTRVTALAEEPDWKKLERRFKKARKTDDVARLSSLVGEVGSHDSARAAKSLIDYTLYGIDHGLEKKAGKALALMASKESRKVIYQEALEHKNYKTRIVLLGVAYYQRKDPGAFRVLVHGAHDSKSEVARAAIYWLRQMKDPRAVDALISALSQHEKSPRQGRVYFDLRRALKELTGYEFDVAADWKNYWEGRKTGKASPPKKGKKKPGRTWVPQKFFSLDIDSDRVVFIIDVSQSMERRDSPRKSRRARGQPNGKKRKSGKTVVGDPEKGKGTNDPNDPNKPAAQPVSRERLFRVKEELIRTIKVLPKDTTFTIQSFSNEVRFLGDSVALIQATPQNKNRAVAWVQGLKPFGETWTDTAFERVFKEVPSVDTIFFLSDGAPYRQGARIPQDDVLTLIDAVNRFAKCRINTIGFRQSGANLRRFLRRLSDANDGKFTQLE